MKRFVEVLIIAISSTALVPIVSAHNESRYRPVAVRLPGPSSNTAKAIDAWRTSEVKAAKDTFKRRNEESSREGARRIVLNLRLSTIRRAAEDMHHDPHWATAEPWIVDPEPMPATCGSPSAKLTAWMAVSEMIGKHIPIHALHAIHPTSAAGPKLSCDYSVRLTPANGGPAQRKFSLAFVPDESHFLVGNVLGKAYDVTPQ